ncbi:MAG: alpha-L-rhamnosidase, partial [Nitrospiraceae bacterium]|nr:alpha-L-rhamnosidase [Nitrospiraceae bacterium]
DRERGVYVDGEGTDHASLHANMFPLAFGLVPEKYVPGVVQYIKSRGMACSVYGAQYLLEALYNVGESQYTLDLMTSGSKRSWMNMIRVGSTMTTEAWDEYYKPNLTWNHAWGSAPANIIARKLFGIEPLEPAFKKVRIKPQPGNLQHAKLKMPTIRGTICCSWEVKNNRFNFDVTIPVNTSAEVWLPTILKNTIKESGQGIKERKDIFLLGEKDRYVVCEIGAGIYGFSGDIK